jgi:hypothetical protein
VSCDDHVCYILTFIALISLINRNKLNGNKLDKNCINCGQGDRGSNYRE